MDFDCIYKSYYLDVYHFLCGLSSNKEIAEDITHETFGKRLLSIHNIRFLIHMMEEKIYVHGYLQLQEIHILHIVSVRKSMWNGSLQRSRSIFRRSLLTI